MALSKVSITAGALVASTVTDMFQDSRKPKTLPTTEKCCVLFFTVEVVSVLYSTICTSYQGIVVG